MKAYTALPFTALLLVSTMGLMACGDTEDHYLEPGYGRNFNPEAEKVQLAQVRTNGDQERPWLLPNPQVESTLLRTLNEVNEDREVRDVFNLDEPIDTENEVLNGAALDLAPQLSPPSEHLIETMTPEELSRTCASIEARMAEVGDEDRVTATCTFDYMAAINGAQAPDDEACNLRMSKCIDQSTGPINPIAFCQTPNKVPATCEVSYPEITACLNTLKQGQQALTELDICDASVLTSQDADTGYDAVREAQTCLLKLDTYCPVLLNE